jgi:hypothetical protein
LIKAWTAETGPVKWQRNEWWCASSGMDVAHRGELT